MIRKVLTIGVLGLVLAIAGCRNPDDRRTQVATEHAVP